MSHPSLVYQFLTSFFSLRLPGRLSSSSTWHSGTYKLMKVSNYLNTLCTKSYLRIPNLLKFHFETAFQSMLQVLVLFTWVLLYSRTRDLPGDALVFKRKYNLEKRSKMAILEYFSIGTKNMGNHSKFYFSWPEPSGKHPVLFYCCQYIELWVLVEPCY